MKKKGMIILGVVIVLIVILIDSVTPKEIDWSPTYNEKQKNPFDLKVFHDQLGDIFKEKNIKTLTNTFYEYQEEYPNTIKNTNNIYINIDIQFEPDASSENKLLTFIGNGNSAFISANNFSESLLDSLQIDKNFKTETTLVKTDTIEVSTHTPKTFLKYDSKLKFSQNYFKDSSNIKSLGEVSLYVEDSTNISKTNFIEVKYKKGIFYLHTQPEVFSNYHLLKAENTDYINTILSYLPTQIVAQENKFNSNQFVYFESNYKLSDSLLNSPLRFIKKEKELYTAWTLLWVGIALFLIINAKRKQKIIPIIPKVRNTSIDFVETIATLYEEADNFQPMIHHKINIFYKNIRNTYNIITDSTNPKLASQLSLKSGYDLKKTKELIRYINTIKNRDTSSITLLKKLNKDIEDFNKKTNAWKKN